jgi:pilus assembly protein CpaC
MHHQNPVRHSALWSTVLCLLLGSAVSAQPPMPGGAPAPARPAGPVIIGISTSQRVQMTTRRRISNVNNPKPNVARVQAVVDDPTAVLITGLEAGVVSITLTDEGGTKETVEVLVQTDVEYLGTVLKRAAPTSTIFPIPAANGAVILTGNVAHADDVDGIMKTAFAVVGGSDRVINMMRVGGVMQVQLDVCIAEVNRTEARTFGFNLLASGPSAIFGSTVGNVTGVIPTVGTTPPSSFNNGGNGGGSQQTTGLLTGGQISASPAASNLFLGVVSNGTSYFGFLQALRNEQLAKILAHPRVVTLSGRPASFLSGGEQAVPVPAGLGQIGVQFEEFGTRLNVLPIVMGNGKIHLEVEPEVSSLNAAFGTTISGATVPGRDTQRVHTTVEMEDGQTFVIGGLIQRQVNAATNKVPVLGDLPFLGAAFSTKSFTEQEQELVVLVTPHLVDAMACDQAPKILPGQESRSPDDFELFLEGIVEAPRGPRVVCPNYRYVPAYKNGPTSALFPCGDGNGGCGANGCAPGTPGCTQPGCGTALLNPATTDQAPAGVARPASLPLTTTGVGGPDR